MHEGCYRQPEGSPLQSADLLADFGRLGKCLEGVGASVHGGFLCREIDEHVGELPEIVEVPVARDRVVEELERGVVVATSMSDVPETAQRLAEGMACTGWAAVLDDLSGELLGPGQIVVPQS
jgi:hypothetical protein